MGLSAVERPHHFRVAHSKIPHALRLVRHRLMYPHLGREERLTLVEGEVIEEIL